MGQRFPDPPRATRDRRPGRSVPAWIVASVMMFCVWHVQSSWCRPWRVDTPDPRRPDAGVRQPHGLMEGAVTVSRCRGSHRVPRKAGRRCHRRARAHQREPVVQEEPELVLPRGGRGRRAAPRTFPSAAARQPSACSEGGEQRTRADRMEVGDERSRPACARPDRPGSAPSSQQPRASRPPLPDALGRAGHPRGRDPEVAARSRIRVSH